MATIDKNAQILFKEYGRLSSVNLSLQFWTEAMASAVMMRQIYEYQVGGYSTKTGRLLA